MLPSADTLSCSMLSVFPASSRANHCAKVISPTKAKAPVPPGKGKRHPFADDEDGEDEGVVAQGATTKANAVVPSAGDVAAPSALLSPVRRASASEASRPEPADMAGAVAAAEIVQLESVATMGDGKHDAFTCHCWGLEGTLWAVNEPGQLVSPTSPFIRTSRASLPFRVSSKAC